MLALVLPLEALACTNFIVGKQASADGSTIISYAADSYGMYGFCISVLRRTGRRARCAR